MLSDLTVWTDQLAAGRTIADVHSAIIADALGAMAIDAEYRDGFGRSASGEEIAIWRGAFAQGSDPGTLIVFNTEHLVVTGFDPVADTIDLRGSALGGSNPLAFALEVVSLDGRHDVLIATAAHDLLLTGVTLAQLSAGDFLI